MPTHRRRALAGVVALALVALGAFFLAPHLRATPAQASIGGPFSLVDQAGTPVTDRDVLGKPALLFFGFTHCPDICPTTLFEISSILDRLGPRADDVTALFVTVDPERDTPQVLRDYLSAFPHIRGLTGSRRAVDAMLRAYGVTARKVPLSGGNYTMDHTASVFLIGRDGRFVAPLDVAPGPDAAADELSRRLS